MATGRRSLVRTDLDALPVQEETGVPYASTVTTKNDEGQEVQSCTRAATTSTCPTFIGTARALAKLKDKWHGTIIFIGQPAEETVGGARAMLKDGLYTRWPKPDYALGLHDNAEIADRPDRGHGRLRLCQCRFGRCNRAWRRRPRRLSAQDEGPDRAVRGNDQRLANNRESAKTTRSIRSW